MTESATPTRWFAFLRAINVGGHTVKMERLTALFRELGLEDVETFIASGNVVFRSSETDAAQLERRLEAHLSEALGYEVASFLRTRAELATVADRQPFGEEPGGTVYVGFLARAPEAAAAGALRALGNEVDEFDVLGREVYWLGRKGMGRSTFSGARLERTLGMAATLRNLNTVRRLLEKYD